MIQDYPSLADSTYGPSREKQRHSNALLFSRIDIHDDVDNGDQNFGGNEYDYYNVLISGTHVEV